MMITPISQAKLKLFSSLHIKKYRNQEKLYLIEGKKLVSEALKSNIILEAIIFSAETLPKQEQTHLDVPFQKFVAQPHDFRRLTSVEQSEGIVAVIKMPDNDKITPYVAPSMVLLGLQDPGNVGSLIRTAAWFNFKGVYLGQNTVDIFNPKTLRATMGACFKIPTFTIINDLEFLMPIAEFCYCGVTRQSNIRFLSPNSYIILGQETHGIPNNILSIPNIKHISIPGGGTESLNVLAAGSILAYQLYNVNWS